MSTCVRRVHVHPTLPFFLHLCMHHMYTSTHIPEADSAARSLLPRPPALLPLAPCAVDEKEEGGRRMASSKQPAVVCSTYGLMIRNTHIIRSSLARPPLPRSHMSATAVASSSPSSFIHQASACRCGRGTGQGQADTIAVIESTQNTYTHTHQENARNAPSLRVPLRSR